MTLSDADFAGESFYNPMLPDVIEELGRKGLARASEGALCVFPAGFTGEGGEPLPLIVRKQDGGYGYAATDLAAIRHRLTTVGARAARLCRRRAAEPALRDGLRDRARGGLARAAGPRPSTWRSARCSGADKKMFKTRSRRHREARRTCSTKPSERAAKVVREKNPSSTPRPRTPWRGRSAWAR